MELVDYMGRGFSHDGEVGIGWVITWASGYGYETELYDSTIVARNRAAALVKVHGDDPGFLICVERTVIVRAEDFVDLKIPEHEIGVMPDLWLERQFRG